MCVCVNVFFVCLLSSSFSLLIFFLPLPPSNRYKYARPGTKMTESAWGGERYPNASTSRDAIGDHSIVCGDTGCLFNVNEDIREEHEISAKNPELVSELQLLLDEEASTIWSQPHGNDPKCRETAWSRYGGYFGPWLELPSDKI